MTQKNPNVTVRIDRITSDQPGLESAALQAALLDEVRRVLAIQGAPAFGNGGHHSQKQATLSEGSGALHTRIAAATIKAVSS